MNDAAAVGETPRSGDIQVNQVSVSRPWVWIARGWQDMRRAGGFSLAYGAGVVALSLTITAALALEGWTFLVPFLAAGFFLIAPIIGLGLYQMSARLERDEPLRVCHFWEALRRSQGQISMIIAGLSIILQIWIAMSFVLFALLYQGMHPPLDDFVARVFLSEEGRVFTIASLLLGFALAWVAYAISAVSVPMLMDRNVDGFTAIRTSVRAVVANWPAMTLWAALIVAFIGLGLATFYLGLVVAMPLVGHATWHAYRDLVPREE